MASPPTGDSFMRPVIAFIVVINLLPTTLAGDIKQTDLYRRIRKTLTPCRRSA
jgi:hypothetical protein